MSVEPKTVKAHRIILRDLGVTMILLSSHAECERPEISQLINRLDEAVNMIIEEMRRRAKRSSK